MPKNRKRTCAAIVLAICWPWCFALAQGEASPTDQAAVPSLCFQQFLQTLWPLAEQKGVSRPTFDAALSELEPDPAVPAASERQAEFERPLKSYLNEAISPRRIARGRECLHAWRAELLNIDKRFGVPATILVAAFGLESDYGRAKGQKDIVRSLATLAYMRPDRSVFRDELISALVMLDKRGISRAAMRGSWAGAMGGAQFLPSVYLKYAVNYAPGGPRIFGIIPSTPLHRSQIFYASPAGSRAFPGEWKLFCLTISLLFPCIRALPPLPSKASKAPLASPFHREKQAGPLAPDERGGGTPD